MKSVMRSLRLVPHNFLSTNMQNDVERLLILGWQEKSRISTLDIQRAQSLRPGSPLSLSELLVELGMISERDRCDSMAKIMALPLFAVANSPDMALDNLSVSPPFLRQYRVCPISESDGVLNEAMADPHLPYAKHALELASNLHVQPIVATGTEILAMIERLYGEAPEAAASQLDGVDANDDPGLDDIEHLRDMAQEAPVIRLVNQIIQRAIDWRASDIHIEPFEQRLSLRYRVDGVLQDADAPPMSMAAAIVSRLKIMAKLDIAERRLPQDGRLMVRMQGRTLDLRASVLPTAFGESVVLRLLDRENLVLDFEAMGFAEPVLPAMHALLERPNGILLVTGPTGSGKTTTLYGALARLNQPGVKIITVEDPVEYQLSGINQMQVKPQIGLDFANALRAIVRQDPDVVMIGEMRDTETARIAMQSALTGHLVLSTLHTNSAAGGITRLLDMGIEPYLINSTVNGILAQRLVRILNPAHREAYAPSPEQIARWNLRHWQPTGEIRLYRPKASVPAHLAYQGRTVISELMPLDDCLREAVLRHAGMAELERLAEQQGMQSLWQSGIRKALAGITSIEEVLRVCPESAV